MLNNLIFLIILILACSVNTHEVNKSSNLSERDSIISEYKSKIIDYSASNSFSLDIGKYKLSFDSIISEILNLDITSDLRIDTIRNGELLILQPRPTIIKGVSEKENIGINYEFNIKGKYSGLKHSISILNFSSKNISSSTFETLKEVSVEKSGVPGLTYSNDFLYQHENFIFWINSNCPYSFENHLRFASLFQEVIEIKSKEEINCKCGKVYCKIVEK